jgi:hypothetical protein
MGTVTADFTGEVALVTGAGSDQRWCQLLRSSWVIARTPFQCVTVTRTAPGAADGHRQHRRWRARHRPV